MLSRLFFLVAISIASWAQTLGVMGWNVESGDAELNTLKATITKLQGQQASSLWGFSEVQNQQWADAFAAAAGSGFKSVVGTTGGGDLLAIVYDDSKLELLNKVELHHINIGGNVRSPLVGHFRLRQGAQQLLFMVNHLYRSNSEARHQQATLLKNWAQQQSLPVIAVGDYNFDWDAAIGDTSHDAGYDLMTSGGVFQWVRPADLVNTQCSFNSVLDFVFVAGPARLWTGDSRIMFREDANYCPDNSSRSDHRPVFASFSLTTGGGQPSSGISTAAKAALMVRLNRLEKEVQELKAFIGGN